MSKYYVTSNSMFGYKKNIDSTRFLTESLNYYNNELIPFISKYHKTGDIFIHLGNMFSVKTLNFKLIKSIQDIFEKISKIIPVYLIENESDSLTIFRNFSNIFIIEKEIEIDNVLLTTQENSLSPYKKIISGYYKDHSILNNIVYVGAPYQYELNDKLYSCYIYDTYSDAGLHVTNKTSSRFLTITVNNINELLEQDKNMFNSNYINLQVSSNLYNSNEFKINIINYKCLSINIIPEEHEEVETTLNSGIFNIDELIYSKIKDSELELEFNKIKKLVR